MSSDNRGSVPVPPNAPVYTIYPGHQGSTNYGFHPQAPPPKYEDVISGEYLKWNYSGTDHAPSMTQPNPMCNCSHPQAASPRVPSPSESELSREGDPKVKRHNAIGAIFFGILLIVIFIWRVSAM